MGNVASNTVNQMAFCPPPPTYRKQDVNMWLETDRGSRIPAFHIRRGYPLTVLVSHANAEDLGIVLGFWSWLSDRLQVGRAFCCRELCAVATTTRVACALDRWMCLRMSTLDTAMRPASRARRTCTRMPVRPWPAFATALSSSQRETSCFTVRPHLPCTPRPGRP